MQGGWISIQHLLNVHRPKGAAVGCPAGVRFLVAGHKLLHPHCNLHMEAEMGWHLAKLDHNRLKTACDPILVPSDMEDLCCEVKGGLRKTAQPHCGRMGDRHLCMLCSTWQPVQSFDGVEVMRGAHTWQRTPIAAYQQPMHCRRMHASFAFWVRQHQLRAPGRASWQDHNP